MQKPVLLEAVWPVPPSHGTRQERRRGNTSPMTRNPMSMADAFHGDLAAPGLTSSAKTLDVRNGAAHHWAR